MTENEERLGSSNSQDSKDVRPSLVAAFRTMLVERDVAESAKFRQWAQYRLAQLKDFHIENDFEHLVAAGVAIQTLAVAGLLINIAPGFDFFLKKCFGDAKARRKKAEVLASAVQVMKEFEALLQIVEKESADGKNFGFPLASTVTSGLEHYAFILTAGDVAFEFLEANSVLEVAKYALAASVHNITGKYYDREVSAVTGAALQKFDYDETSHRVWRIRNMDRLAASKAAFLRDMLVVLNELVTQKPNPLG